MLQCQVIERIPIPGNPVCLRVPIDNYVANYFIEARRIRDLLRVVRQDQIVSVVQLLYVVMKSLNVKSRAELVERLVHLVQGDLKDGIACEIDLSGRVGRTEGVQEHISIWQRPDWKRRFSRCQRVV